jgi:O-antigen chain-terminating methyltransferase
VPYVALARDQQPLFDAGCGRGELLVAVREAGVSASGCDTNERSVADLKARGFDVDLAGIPECFAKTPDGSLGSIAALHVVEHLPVDALFALFREAARTLRKGGLLMIETPNAESLLVGASDFWRDPTHIAPRHPAALTLLAREHGFSVEEVVAVHPLPDGTALAVADDDPPGLRRVVDAINARVFGPQDLRMILRHSLP